MGTKPYPRSKPTIQAIPPYQTLLKKYDKRNRSLYLGPQLNQIASCSNDEWIQIIDCLDWNEIKQLTLYKCQVGDVYLEMLNQLALTSLQSLRLCDIKITVKGLNLLISSSLNYLCLESLVLDGNNIGFSGFQSLLKQSKSLKKLNKLSLNNCGIQGKQFKKLLLIKYELPFQGIKQLFLNDNNIGSQGYKIFSKISLNFLQNLSITNTQLNTEGIRHIIKSQFHNLQNLNIKNNKINYTGYLSILHNNWKKLNYLQVGDNKNNNSNNINMNRNHRYRYRQRRQKQVIDPIIILYLNLLNNNRHGMDIEISWASQSIQMGEQLKKISGTVMLYGDIDEYQNQYNQQQ